MRRPTLGQAFFVATLAILAVVAIGFTAFLRQSHASILAESERLRENAARRIETQVHGVLGGAESALADIEREIRAGAVDPHDTRALEVALWRELVGAPRLAEVTFSGATLLGYDSNGDARLDEAGRFQVSLFRTPEGHVVTRVTERRERGFVALTRDRGPSDAFATEPLAPSGPGMDPTEHATFSVLAMQQNRGRAVWSDLHYSELDHGKPNPRVVVSVQKAIEDEAGHFAGVVRVALLTTDLDAISGVKLNDDAKDPHRVLLLAVSEDKSVGARLVARVDPRDRVDEFGDELRIVPDHPPPVVAGFLSSPLVRGLEPDHPNGMGTLDVSGERYLATLRELPDARGGTVGWFVAVLVPEAYYTADLVRFERAFLWVFGATLAVVLGIGVVTIGAIRRGLGEVVGATVKMRGFDFAPAKVRSPFRDVDDVLLGLERAKTVVRAMGKYIPLDLVKRLYEKNSEPELGGELREVSLMFTDIEGFTTLSERLPPDELSRRLGDYLEAMTAAVAATNGTIDKYIGDAVMAFWNAPAPVADHAAKACEAVLECKRRTALLFSSETWNGLPPLVTRFGIHRAEVMVGHFGAVRRMSYTALGDGVNLAARLEPLCKQYGVTVLASETIVHDAGLGFVFRRVDRVRVKGKTKGIDVYELLGKRGEDIPGLERCKRYEEGFAAYLAREFERAIVLLEPQLDDPPSRVLSERCQELRKRAPPPDWNGVHVAVSK